LKKQALIPFLSVDMSTDMLINDKQKKINKRVFIDFAKMIGDVQSESSFFLKLSRDEEIFSGYKTIVKGKSRQEKENLKLKIFENFKRAKKALLGKQRKFNMEELDKEILEGRNVNANLIKMFNIIKQNKDKRTANIKRIIKEPTKLFSLFVRNIPEKKPSVEDFKSNNFPIYSYNLVEVILAEPSEKKEIKNWKKTTKNLGGGDLETWARVYPKSEEKNFQAKKKGKIKLRSKLVMRS
jgi:hypothetical protein